MIKDESFGRITKAEIISRLLDTCFEDVVLINVKSGRVLNLSDRVSKRTSTRKYDGMAYDKQLLLTAEDFSSDTEFEVYSNAMLLSNVIEKLEKTDSYVIELFYTDRATGKSIYKEITYKYFDSKRDIILMLCRDVSNIVLNEIDPLTGIYDSTGFHNHIKKWIELNPGRRFRVQRYNIDKFRDINGVYGYDIGNNLLRDFGECMKQFDTVDSFSAHLNADHFARFCADDVCTVEQCYNNFNKCFENYKLNMPIKLHMGVYDLCEDDCDSYTMSYKALLALQTIKGKFTKRIAYYEKGMMAIETTQQELLADVQTAIDTEQFEVWFQPQVDFEKNRIIGAEALVRWRHPKLGLLTPNVFIPILEKKSDCIGTVDGYVLDKVCAYMRKWHDEIPGGYIPVSVNLSRNDIYRKDLCQKLTETINKYGIPPEKIHLEITESSYMDDSKLFFDTMLELRRSGFLVEMDDFGSGYSSLNSLKDISIDKLKLDMKFLMGAEGNQKAKVILSAVINMARVLGIPVIAEGVETEEQAKMLLEFGCKQMQGYYFSRPVPADDYGEMLKNQKEQ